MKPRHAGSASEGHTVSFTFTIAPLFGEKSAQRCNEVGLGSDAAWNIKHTPSDFCCKRQYVFIKFVFAHSFLKRRWKFHLFCLKNLEARAGNRRCITSFCSNYAKMGTFTCVFLFCAFLFPETSQAIIPSRVKKTEQNSVTFVS